jgi:hypothetical protein
MAPQSWASPEEQDFLRSFLPEYEECQVKRKYKSFWQRVNRDYFAKFPVAKSLFPSLSSSELSDEQKAECTTVTLRQQKVCGACPHPFCMLTPDAAYQGMVPVANEPP